MYRIGYLGPQGTFSEEAAHIYTAGREWEKVDCSTLENIFTDVSEGKLNKGVVPVENSTEGAVSEVLDLLAGPFDLAVHEEIVMPVYQSLLTRSGVKLEQVERVLSHPQALAQCRNFLRRNLPAALPVECSSTAAAIKQVAACNRSLAALGPAGAAGRYGLKVNVPAANDYPDNVTRFWVLGREQLSCSEENNCKTSLIFTVKDRPGALYAILREFALRNINLTRLESRPAKKNLGDYLFIIDFAGGLHLPLVDEALRETASLTVTMKVLGAYPVRDVKRHGRYG